MAADIYMHVVHPSVLSLANLRYYRDTFGNSIKKDSIYEVISQTDSIHLGELTYEYPPFDDLELYFKRGRIIDSEAIDLAKSAWKHSHHSAPDELITFLNNWRGRIAFTFVW